MNYIILHAFYPQDRRVTPPSPLEMVGVRLNGHAGVSCIIGFTGAMVLGEEVLHGAIPMEDMDVVIQPSLLKVAVNPQSQNLPMSVAKGQF